MNKLTQVSRKFAAKIGLESRPANSFQAMPSDDLDTLPQEEQNSEEMAPPSAEIITPTLQFRGFLYDLQANFHSLKENIDLENYENSLDRIAEMILLLKELEIQIEQQGAVSGVRITR